MEVSVPGFLRSNNDGIYTSGREVFLREFMQNAQDGITARRALHPGHQGMVHLEIVKDSSGMSMMIEDNGIGISLAESRLALSTIAFSSKRSAEAESSDSPFVGRFGMGLLSGFLVADEISIFSRRAESDDPGMHWVGRSDGMFKAAPSDSMKTIGTRVFLRFHQEASEQFSADDLLEIARKYGRYLPHPVSFRCGALCAMVTDEAPLWEQEIGNDELLEKGRDLFDSPMISAFRFESAEAAAKGVAFIQAEGCHPTAETSHIVFIKHMMVSDHALDLEPANAPFLRLILNSDRLCPNIGRDAVMASDAHLPALRRDVECALKKHLHNLRQYQPAICAEVVTRHYRCIAQLAQKDRTYLAYLIDYLPLETTLGRLTLSEVFHRHGGRLEYVTDTTEFQRLQAKARTEGDCIARVETEPAHRLMELVSDASNGTKVQRISARDYLARFANKSSTPTQREALMIDTARAELAKENCLAAFYETDDTDEIVRLDLSTDESLDRFLALSDADGLGSKQLMLNRHHPMVSQMIDGAADAEQLRVWLRVLYHLALLDAREVPTAAEARRFSRALGNVFTASTLNIL